MQIVRLEPVLQLPSARGRRQYPQSFVGYTHFVKSKDLPLVRHASNIFSSVDLEQTSVRIGTSSDDVLGVPTGIHVPYGTIVMALKRFKMIFVSCE